MQNPNTRGAVGLCLEPHDLVVAKLMAGREKDLRFARDAVATHLVSVETLAARLDDVTADERLLEAARRRISSLRT